METPLVSIKNLTVRLNESLGGQAIVKDFSLDIFPKRVMALVGGSGSGKTTTGLAIVRLLPGAMHVRDGQIIFNGEDLLKFPEERMRALRGKEIGMVFQEPLNAFNPVFRIGYQIEEVLKYHTGLSGDQRAKRIEDLLGLVGISDPQRIAESFPHQLSGGLRQRAMIAQAIAADPKLIIADEPTSNLDVTLQAHIMELFRRLRKELDLSILLITHDLGVVQHLADEVAVLTGGVLVEHGTTQTLLEKPRHDYTRQLIEAFR